MAAQVEVQAGEVGRTCLRGRVHLSPLTDSSNKGLSEGPSSTHGTLIVVPEPTKPAPGPKPRLTPKPFSVERNPTIRPIIAPKPHSKPHPEPTHPAGYKPDPPSTSKPKQPAVGSKPRLVSTNPTHPSPTSFKQSAKQSTGQTTKPVVHPFKPAPPLTHGEFSKPTPPIPAEWQKPGAAGLSFSRSPKKYPSAEWFGITKKEEENDKISSKSPAGTSMTRAKSMGFLNQLGQEGKQEETKPQAGVHLPQPRGSRSRPVSAIFFPSSSSNYEPQVPSPRWEGRRPLSADLTAKFESIGLSLHRKNPMADSKENTPEPRTPTSLEGTTPTSQGAAKPIVSQMLGVEKKKVDEIKNEEDVAGASSIKRRISLLLDSSSSSPGTGAIDQGSTPQPIAEQEAAPLGIKQRIKKLTEDVPPAPSPPAKPTAKPRSLPLDLTTRFISERTTDLSSPSLSEPEHSLKADKDLQQRDKELAVNLGDQKRKMEHTSSSTAVGLDTGSSSKDGRPGGEAQMVRASLFENVIERRSVLVLDGNDHKESVGSMAPQRVYAEDGRTLVTASYREPVSPAGLLCVPHSFDMVQAVEGSRVVSESIPPARLEDKAMTLRSRHSDSSRLPAAAVSAPEHQQALVQGEPTSVLTPEVQPRYLRIGALPKWNATDTEQEAGTEERPMALDREREREAGEEAAPKRLKMLETDDQPKPRATYFALTGQIQEPIAPEDSGPDRWVAKAGTLDDPLVQSGLWGSQGKIVPMRSPSLEEAFRKNQSPAEEPREPDRGLLWDRQVTEEQMMEMERQRDQSWKAERQKTRTGELEREMLRQVEIERHQHLEFARMKERERQRELERQVKLVFEKESLQEFEQHKQAVLEKEEKQQVLEREKQQRIEREKQQDLEKQREVERDRQRNQERQRELDKEKKQLEIQRERRQQEEQLVRIKEMERRQLMEFERRKQAERKLKEREEAEKLRQAAVQQEVERQRELERRQVAKQREVERQREMEKEHQMQLDYEKQELEKQRLRQEERLRKEELEAAMEMERQRQNELEKEHRKQLDYEKQELEKQRLRQEKERLRKKELEAAMEMERQRQNELEKEHRKQLDYEKQELEKQRLRQEKERQRKEELEAAIEMERHQLLELEKKRLKEKMAREVADKVRQVTKWQEAERQRLMEKQRRESQEQLALDPSPLRPKVLDLDSVLRDDPFSKALSRQGDPAVRWKHPSPRAEEPYKPAILGIDSFTSQTQPMPSREAFSTMGIQFLEGASRVRSQPLTPERDSIHNVPLEASIGRPSPAWVPSPQDPWELMPVEMSVDLPVVPDLPRKTTSKPTLEQLLLRQGGRRPTPERRWSGLVDEPPPSVHMPRKEMTDTAVSAQEQIWFPRIEEPPAPRAQHRSQRRSHGSQLEPGVPKWTEPTGICPGMDDMQELNRMRSRSVSRRSTPLEGTAEVSLSRMRSRSAHREGDRPGWVKQQQHGAGEEEVKDTDALVQESDSQYGTWETGLHTDDSLTPATPTSDSTLSHWQGKPSPPHAPAQHGLTSELDTPAGLSPTTLAESQALSFPEVPTILLDTSMLRSRAQLGKKRAPRSRPTRTTRQSNAPAGGEDRATDDWRFRDSTDEKAENKQENSDSEEQTRVVDPRSTTAAVSQPQRIPLFPGMDHSALKSQLKKRGDSENLADVATPSPSQLSRSPKSPFLPRTARILPPVGSRENGLEDSPQWLKELKSKKRLSQYDNDDYK